MPTAPLGWVLYDESCGVCRRLATRWAKTLRRHGFDLAPLQSAWVSQRLGLPERELLSDLRLVPNRGSHLQGADVYRHVMRRIWWAYPLYLFSIAPLGKHVFNRAYRSFADHRHWISHTCGVSAGETGA